MTAPVAAPIAATITATTAVAVPIAPATVITGAVVPIARAGAAVISASSADDHARLDHRSSIAISGLIARGVGGISGVVAAIRVSRRAVRVDGTAGHEGGRSEDQTCNCEFHIERGGVR
jgi:hypothetical protein